jgi:transcriptional regulator with XRE-family HTH domain
MVAERTFNLDTSAIRSNMNLSRERMARVLKVSAKTIERWEEGQAMPRDDAKRTQLAHLAQLAELGLTVYTPEGFRAFLTTPMPVFEQRTAMQLLENGQIDAVLSALAADYEGTGY